MGRGKLPHSSRTILSAQARPQSPTAPLASSLPPCLDMSASLPAPSAPYNLHNHSLWPRSGGDRLSGLCAVSTGPSAEQLLAGSCRLSGKGRGKARMEISRVLNRRGQRAGHMQGKCHPCHLLCSPAPGRPLSSRGHMGTGQGHWGLSGNGWGGVSIGAGAGISLIFGMVTTPYNFTIIESRRK